VVSDLISTKPANLAQLVFDRHRAVRERERIVAQHEQRLVDAEVRTTRRAVLRALRRRGGANAAGILDEDFLAVADRPTIYEAIVGVAVAAGRAASVDLQLYDRNARVLRLVAQHGFSSRFLAFFAAIGVAQPSACAAAFASRRPVLVDDVTRSAIFVGQPTVEPMLDAGSRAVHSYPLLAAPDDVVGVLSFHYRERAPEPGAVELVVHSAAQVVAQVPKDPFRFRALPQ
jgi:GAF domain-containing protein